MFFNIFAIPTLRAPVPFSIPNIPPMMSRKHMTYAPFCIPRVRDWRSWKGVTGVLSMNMKLSGSITSLPTASLYEISYCPAGTIYVTTAHRHTTIAIRSRGFRAFLDFVDLSFLGLFMLSFLLVIMILFFI